MPSDVINEKLAFLKKAFGSCQMSRDGKNAAISCPKCKKTEKKKLAVRLDDDRVHCWVCGLGGKLVNVLVKYKQSHVREYVTRFAGKNIDCFIDDEEKHDVELPAGFKLLATRMGSDEPRVRAAISYLKRRGLTERDIWYFKFGISDDPSMHNRVIMPSFDGEGKLNFYTGRSLEKHAFRKYMNCDAEKKSIVFNELNIDWSKEITLVEGPFDLTKCDDNATCLLGSSLSEDARLFYQIYSHMTPVLLALDSDMQSKTWQTIARLLASYDIPIRILPLGDFKDVGEMTRQQFIAAKNDARPWDRVTALRLKITGIRT